MVNAMDLMNTMTESGLRDNGPNVKGSELESSLNALNTHELSRLNRIVDVHHKRTTETILDKSFGEVISNTVNFFGDSFDGYQTKLLEAEFTQNIYDTEHPLANAFQKHLIAIALFIRDDDNVIYIGIIMVILSVLICFFNISRSYGRDTADTKS